MPDPRTRFGLWYVGTRLFIALVLAVLVYLMYTNMFGRMINPFNMTGELGSELLEE